MNLINKMNENQDKKINQMMRMINNLQEGLHRVENKIAKTE